MEILNLINQNLHGSNFFNHFFKFISIISDKGLIWIALGIVLLFFKKTRKVGLITIIGVGASFFINSLILKNIFEKARPFVENPELATFIESIGMSLPDSYSFPSGHAFSSFCCAIIIGLGLKKNWWSFYILATLVAFSRVFLCVHYPIDVIVGAMLGTIVGVCVYFVSCYILKKLDGFISKKRASGETTTEENK